MQTRLHSYHFIDYVRWANCQFLISCRKPAANNTQQSLTITFCNKSIQSAFTRSGPTALSLIPVDTSRGETARTPLACTELCSLKVKAFEPVLCHYVIDAIRNIDKPLSEAETGQNVRSPECSTIRLRQLDQSSTVKLSLITRTLPRFVYHGHVRHPASPFKERPIQCKSYKRNEHQVASSKHAPICSRCGDAHHDDAPLLRKKSS